LLQISNISVFFSCRKTGDDLKKISCSRNIFCLGSCNSCGERNGHHKFWVLNPKILLVFLIGLPMCKAGKRFSRGKPPIKKQSWQ